MITFVLITVPILLFVALVAFIWARLMVRNKRASRESKRRRVALVVLGSGGHTTEMLYQLRSMRWSDIVANYVVANTDRGSAHKAQAFEESLGRTAQIYTVPRAREVGQSYFTSVFTTLKASLKTAGVVWEVCPDLVLCNGPGTCVPVAAFTYLFRIMFGIGGKIVYTESFACVNHMSLSGRILYPFLADGFVVQWEQLRQLYPRSQLIPVSPPRPLSVAKEPFVLVTVGSTVFDALIRAVDCPEFLDVAARLGCADVRIQHGATRTPPRNLRPNNALSVSCFEYHPDLPAMIARAKIVVTHAGAGSILDGLSNGAKMVVVPNPILMDNHQAQLAEAVSHPEARYAFSSNVNNVVQTLSSVDFSELKPFPFDDSPRFQQFVDSICSKKN